MAKLVVEEQITYFFTVRLIVRAFWRDFFQGSQVIMSYAMEGGIFLLVGEVSSTLPKLQQCGRWPHLHSVLHFEGKE